MTIPYQGNWVDAEEDMAKEHTKQPPRQTILQEAHTIIYGDREETYGTPSVNLERIARLWRAHLIGRYGNSVNVTEEDVCWMMMQVKQARQMNKPKRDNLVDAAGYIALIERIQEN